MALRAGADKPLLVGSLKTNLGHMEAAAGIGGLLKLVLALQHGEVPAHLHFETPTRPHPLGRTRTRVPRSTMPWPKRQNAAGEVAPRLGAVSSFGFSGTNAHLVIEQAHQVQPEAFSMAREEPAAEILPLSAGSAAALRDVIERYEQWLSSPATAGYDWPDIAATAAIGRNHHRRRVAPVARTREEAVASLRLLREAPIAASRLRASAHLLPLHRAGKRARWDGPRPVEA